MVKLVVQTLRPPIPIHIPPHPTRYPHTKKQKTEQNKTKQNKNRNCFLQTKHLPLAKLSKINQHTVTCMFLLSYKYVSILLLKEQHDITGSLENVNLQRWNFGWVEKLLFQVAWEVRSAKLATVTSDNVFDLFLLGSKMQGVKSMPAWRRPNTQTSVYCFDGTNGMMIDAQGCLNFLPVASNRAWINKKNKENVVPNQNILR